MEFQLKFKLNNHLYLKDPENSEVGKAIVKNAIALISEIGFEHFTFKKLAVLIDSTEATIYRYFSSKHKLLIYILNWYWSYLEFVSKMRVNHLKSAEKKLKIVLEIITHNDTSNASTMDYNLTDLHNIVVSESSKSYLVKEVDLINKEMVFSPLKSFCLFISELILTIKPDFQYSKSLASTLLETAHHQHFFSEHLPKLTDYNNEGNNEHKQYVLDYLTTLTFSVIK